MPTKSRLRVKLWVLPATIVAAGALAWGATSFRSRAAGTLHVPRIAAPIVINAEIEGKKVWESEMGCTQNLKNETGQGMVPFTQAKVRWTHDKLYLLLYAGDLDLEGTVTAPDGPVDKDDSFELKFGVGDQVRVLSVSVLGTVADALCDGVPASRHCDSSWQSRAEVAVDRDGTLNQVGDNDEEWVVEMAVPFSRLGIANPTAGTRIPFSVRRCEVARSGVRACGSWGERPRGELLLDG